MTKPTLPIHLFDGGAPPHRAHPSDGGLDCKSATKVTIPSGQRRMVRLGFATAIPHGHVGLLAGRSGLGARHGIRPSNCVGIIDAAYRGEIKASLTNDGREPYTVHHGDRVAQLIIVPALLLDPEIVDQLPPSDRGTNGFGSTGHN